MRLVDLDTHEAQQDRGGWAEYMGVAALATGPGTRVARRRVKTVWWVQAVAAVGEHTQRLRRARLSHEGGTGKRETEKSKHLYFEEDSGLLAQTYGSANQC